MFKLYIASCANDSRGPPCSTITSCLRTSLNATAYLWQDSDTSHKQPAQRTCPPTPEQAPAAGPATRHPNLWWQCTRARIRPPWPTACPRLAPQRATLTNRPKPKALSGLALRLSNQAALYYIFRYHMRPPTQHPPPP